MPKAILTMCVLAAVASPGCQYNRRPVKWTPLPGSRPLPDPMARASPAAERPARIERKNVPARTPRRKRTPAAQQESASATSDRQAADTAQARAAPLAAPAREQESGPLEIEPANDGAERSLGAAGVRENTPTSPVPSRPARYEIIDVGTLGGDSSAASAINNLGQVVGRADTVEAGNHHAFLWSDGRITDLGADLEETLSEAVAINDVGEIVVCAGEFPTRTYVWGGEHWTDLGSLGGETRGQGINRGGSVTGAAEIHGDKPEDTQTRAFVWDHEHLSDVGATYRDPSTEGRAINDAGEVVGYSHCNCKTVQGPAAFYWDGYVMSALEPLGGSSARAFDINNRGQIVGEAMILTSEGGRVVLAPHACLWDNHQVIDLGTLGGKSSSALSISDAGQVVGWISVDAGVERAFSWQSNMMIDLNLAIPAGSDWVLNRAVDVNESGQIAGSGEYQGRHRAFLLVPVTDPAVE